MPYLYRWIKFKFFKRHLLTHSLNQKNFELLQAIYKDTYGELLSRQNRGTFVKDDYSLVYGEIHFETFAEILIKAAPKPGEIFYDLGSGTGKAVLTAGLLFKFSACVGIELLPSLYQESLSRLIELKKLTSNLLAEVNFIHRNFFEADFTKADIVFISAGGFFAELYDQLVSSLTQLTSGTRIIIISKVLPDSSFTLLHQNYYLMSWGLSRVSIYQKL